MVDYSKWDRMNYNDDDDDDDNDDDDDDDDEISIDEIVNNAISGGGQQHQRSVLDADLAHIRALMGEEEVVTAIPPDDDDNNDYEDDDNNHVDDDDGNEASTAAMHLLQLQQPNQEGNTTNQRYDDNSGIGADNHPNTLTKAKNGGDNDSMSSVDSANDEDNAKWLRVSSSNNTTHHRHTTRIGMEYQVTNLPTRYSDETERMVLHETHQQYNAAHIQHLNNRGAEALFNSDNMNVDDDIDYGRNDDNGVSNLLWMRTATTSSRSSKRKRHTRIGLDYQVAELPPSNNNSYNNINNNNVAVNNNNINYYNVPPPPPPAAAAAAVVVAPLLPDLLPHRSVSPGGSSPEGEQF